METGVFPYVAHPDVFRFTGDTEICQEAMRKVCAASRERNVPLEINFHGIRDNRHYPAEAFWKAAGEEHAPVPFGFVSCDVGSAYDGASLVRARMLAEKFDLRYIGKPPLVFI